MPAIRRSGIARERIWCAVTLSWACVVPVHAAQVDFGVGLSFAHNSNIKRVEENPQSDWTEGAMAGLTYRESTADVSARALAQVERRHFVRNSFSDDTSGFFDGAAVWRILPRRFTWTIEDTFRQVLLDVTAPDTISNRAESNSLNTGPDLTFALSSTNSAEIGARYGRFDIKNSTADNRRYTVFGRGVHALSAQTKVSLNYEAARAYFETGAQPFPRIFRQDWFGRFENLSAVNSTIVDLGTTRVTREGGEPLDGRLARLTLSQAFSSQSRVRLALSDQFSDTYSDLIRGVTSSTAPADTSVVVVVPGANFASGDLYDNKRGDLAYVNNDGRFGYTLQTYERRVDFMTLENNDYQEKGGKFVWTWNSAVMRFNASWDYTRRTFESDRQDTDRNYGASVTFSVNRNVTVSVQGAHSERLSTARLSSSLDNRFVLLLGYSSGFFDVQSRR